MTSTSTADHRSQPAADLTGRTALVTGGATGIGFAAAELLARAGATVYLTGRRGAELQHAARRIGHGAVAIRGDVSVDADLDAIMTRIREDRGRLDILFANAGGAENPATIEEVTIGDVDTTFGINVRGTVFTVQKALPLMGEGASIVVTGSSSAHRGTPGFGVYSATKAAVRQFARVWAAELAPRKIRVNVLTSGSTDTPGLRGLAEDPTQEEAMLAQIAGTNPMQRLAQPTEIAEAALFLASDRSSFMTGSELVVDGGEVQVGV